MVLIFSTPCAAASRSNSVTMWSRSATVRFAPSFWASSVKPTRSVKRTDASPTLSATLAAGCAFRRSAIASGRMLASSASA